MRINGFKYTLNTETKNVDLFFESYSILTNKHYKYEFKNISKDRLIHFEKCWKKHNSNNIKKKYFIKDFIINKGE